MVIKRCRLAGPKYQSKFITTDACRLKKGKNIASNRLRTLNNKINLNDLNEKMTTFKIKIKSLFLNVR